MQSLTHKKQILEANFFNLIVENKLEELSKAIDSNPDLIDLQDPETGMRPIFFAIKHNKIEVLNLLLQKEEALLDTKNIDNHYPIFYAISLDNPIAVLAILNFEPNELNREHFNDNASPLSFASSKAKHESLKVILDFFKEDELECKSKPIDWEDVFLKAIKKFCESENVYRIKDDSLNALNQIYQELFESKTKLREDETKNIKTFFDNFMLLNLAIFGNVGTKEIFFRSLLDRSIMQSENPKDFFQNLQLELNRSINDCKKPFIINGNKFYVFDSDLTDHSSFFIFHLDLEDKINAISYIDGSWLSSAMNSNGNIFGARTYKLNEKLEFSHDLLEDFMSQFENKNADFIQRKLKDTTIGKQKFSDLTQNQSVLTKNQNRGNCVFKSDMILLRFFAENSTNSPMSPELMDKFKEFKTQLKIQAFKNLHKLKDSLDTESALDNFLAKQIDDILLKSKVRLFEKTGAETSDNEFRILKAIDGSTSPRVGQKRIIADDLSTPISKKQLFVDSLESDNFISPQTEIKTQIGVAQHQKLIQNDPNSTVLRF